MQAVVEDTLGRPKSTIFDREHLYCPVEVILQTIRIIGNNGCDVANVSQKMH